MIVFMQKSLYSDYNEILYYPIIFNIYRYMFSFPCNIGDYRNLFVFLHHSYISANTWSNVHLVHTFSSEGYKDKIIFTTKILQTNPFTL